TDRRVGRSVTQPSGGQTSRYAAVRQRCCYSRTEPRIVFVRAARGSGARFELCRPYTPEETAVLRRRRTRVVAGNWRELRDFQSGLLGAPQAAAVSAAGGGGDGLAGKQTVWQYVKRCLHDQ